MQAAEAITHLIAVADRFKSTMQDAQSQEEMVQFENTQVAVHIAQAMLNSMIPVARFRVFVRIESGYPAKDVGAEYTICCTDVSSMKASLRSLSATRRELYIQVWEQRATGADMLLGFQGSTREILASQGKKQSTFVHWLDSLDQFEALMN